MTPWDARRDAQLRALKREGLSFADIGVMLGVTKDAAQKRYRRLLGDDATDSMQTGDVGSVLEALGVRFYQLPPVTPAPPAPSRPVQTALIASDFHFGVETYDPWAEHILLHVAADLRPDLYVANGDIPDLLAVSRYPKDFRTDGPLEEEIRLTKQHYVQMRQALPAGARLVETNANHSGDGVESRWSRHLSLNVPALMQAPAMRERLAYHHVFHDPALGVELLDHVEIVPGLIAIHGDIVRSHAGYSAKAMLEKWRTNLIMGHTHRMGSYGYRVPAIGDKKEHQMRAYEGGCMCKLTAPYLSVANWQQGFCIVHHDGVDFSVEPVLIHNRKAVVGSLGKTYHA